MSVPVGGEPPEQPSEAVQDERTEPGSEALAEPGEHASETHFAGRYVSRDVDAGPDPDKDVGEYTNHDVPPHAVRHPDDAGRYVDEDVTSDHRTRRPQGHYTDSEIDEA